MDKIMKTVKYIILILIILLTMTGCVAWRGDVRTEGVRITTWKYYGFQAGVDGIGFGYKERMDMIIRPDQNIVIDRKDGDVMMRMLRPYGGFINRGDFKMKGECDEKRF
jgi:hypothetical protein